MHLAAGVTAGVIILVMSVTGALLALKPQILNASSKSDVRVVTPPRRRTRLGVQALLAARAARRVPTRGRRRVTLQADPAGVGIRRRSAATGTIYVDPYSGRVLGEGSTRAQQFFRTVEDWHRWLGGVGDRRDDRARRDRREQPRVLLSRASRGPYLWWPRTLVVVEHPRRHLVPRPRAAAARATSTGTTSSASGARRS